MARRNIENCHLISFMINQERSSERAERKRKEKTMKGENDERRERETIYNKKVIEQANDKQATSLLYTKCRNEGIEKRNEK